MPDDAEFDGIVAGSLLPNACTPPLPDDFDFRGIRLAAPRVVAFDAAERDPVLGAFARVMVAGVYCFDANYLGLREQFLERLVVVAVDTGRHRAYSSHLAAAPNAVGGPDPFDDLVLGEADWQGRAVTGYFSPNLAEILPLPAEEASYVAYVALGGYLSNSVRVAVRRRRAP